MDVKNLKFTLILALGMIMVIASPALACGGGGP
jgi:hypothetical protein